jgi:hypothetical protein
MSASTRLRQELRSLGLAVGFFGTWIGMLILIKTLLLKGYHIDYFGWSKVVVGTLVLSKVVLVLEHVSLGAWVRARAAWVGTLLRTALYAAGLVAVLALEHGISERGEAGGFVNAVRDGFRTVGVPHLLVNAICLTGALLVYNALGVVRRHLGEGALVRLFLSPVPAEPPRRRAEPRAGARAAAPGER